MNTAKLLERISDQIDEMEYTIENQNERIQSLELDVAEFEDTTALLEGEIVFLLNACLSGGFSLPLSGHLIDLNLYAPALDPQRGYYESE